MRERCCRLSRLFLGILLPLAGCRGDNARSLAPSPATSAASGVASAPAPSAPFAASAAPSAVAPSPGAPSAAALKPGKEGNRLGYFRVLRSQLRFRLPTGVEKTLELTSLISWRGEWYVVHLHGFD